MGSKDKNIKSKTRQGTINKSTAKPQGKKNDKNLMWYALGVILLTTLVVYFKAIRFDLLIWDDNLYINENEHIKGLGWENIKLFFTSFYAGNYQPLTILMYTIEYKLVGLGPKLYHFNNILLHLFNTVLVFVLAKKLAPKNSYVALITAAFFAIHPMHIESVAWVAERKDVLYTFFFLLSLIFYLAYLQSKKLTAIILAGLFFIFSCMSKSAAVILPLVLILLDYYMNRKITWKTLLEKLPFLLISLVFGLVALQSQKQAMPVTQTIPILDRLFIVSDSFITYLVKAFVPVRLSAFYPYPAELGGTLPFYYYVSLVFVILVLAFVWYSRRWGKDVIFGFLFFVITIALVLQIITVGNATMADRYTYVPFIGIFFIIGKLYENLASKAKNANTLLIILVIGFLIFAGASFARMSKWRNDETLFTDVIGKFPKNPLAYNNRGCYYLKIAQADSLADNNLKKDMYFKKSFQDFDNLVKVDDDYFHGHYNRGLSRYFLKDYANAIKDYSIEIQNNPRDTDAYFDRGNAKKESGDYAGAIQDFDKVLEMKPRSESAYFNRGNAKKEINDYAGAIQDYDKAIELNPKLIKAYNNRSLLKCLLKDYAGTIADYDKLIELNPNDSTTIKNREIIRKLMEQEKK